MFFRLDDDNEGSRRLRAAVGPDDAESSGPLVWFLRFTCLLYNNISGCEEGINWRRCGSSCCYQRTPTEVQ
jgi:hypothetical protein